MGRRFRSCRLKSLRFSAAPKRGSSSQAVWRCAVDSTEPRSRSGRPRCAAAVRETRRWPPRSGATSMSARISANWSLGSGQHRAQLGHRTLLGRQSRDMDEKAAQQVAGGVVPVRLALKAGAHHQHVGKSAGAADDIGVVGVEGIEPIQRMTRSVGHGIGVDHEDILPYSTAGAGGDRIVLALEIENKSGSGIVEEVGDHRTDALAGAGRGAGQYVAVMIKTAAAARQVAKRKGVGRRRGFEMPAKGGLARPAKIEPWVVCGAGPNKTAQPPRNRPGNSRGPRASNATNRPGHNSQTSQPSGQPVTAWSRANGSQLAGKVISNNSENPTAPRMPSRSAKRRKPTTTRISAIAVIPIKASGMVARARRVRAWYPL